MNRIKEIKGYEGYYEVTDAGDVYSCERLIFNGKVYFKSPRKKLTATKEKLGYYSVALSKNCQPKRFRIHRLVAQAFIPNIQNERCINHIDGNKANNHFTNLEWCSHLHNNRHAKRLGLNKEVGSTHHAAKFTNGDVLQIRNQWNLGKSIKEIAVERNCGSETIKNIVHNKSYTNVQMFT